MLVALAWPLLPRFTGRAVMAEASNCGLTWETNTSNKTAVQLDIKTCDDWKLLNASDWSVKWSKNLPKSAMLSRCAPGSPWRTLSGWVRLWLRVHFEFYLHPTSAHGTAGEVFRSSQLSGALRENIAEDLLESRRAFIYFLIMYFTVRV